jgi:hypothetical protein
MGAGHSMQTSNDDFMSDNVLDEFLRIGGTPSDNSTELSNGEISLESAAGREGGVQPAEVVMYPAGEGGEEGTPHSTELSNDEITLESAAGEDDCSEEEEWDETEPEIEKDRRSEKNGKKGEEKVTAGKFWGKKGEEMKGGRKSEKREARRKRSTKLTWNKIKCIIPFGIQPKHRKEKRRRTLSF